MSDAFEIAFLIDQKLNIFKQDISVEEASKEAVKDFISYYFWRFDVDDEENLARAGLSEFRRWGK